MQHILNIAFDFDDGKVKKQVEAAIENNLNDIIKAIITDQIAPMGYDIYTRKRERNWDNFNAKVDRELKIFIEDHKEEILERSATKIAESLKRTKLWREKVDGIID